MSAPAAATPRWLRRLAAAAVSSLVALVLLEAGLRLAPVNRADEARADLRSSFLSGVAIHPQWGTAFRAGVDLVWDYTGRESTPIHIDVQTLPLPGQPEWGMRDDGIDADATRLIPVFGDSFTWGATVQRDEIWCERVERAVPGLDLIDLAQGGGLAKAAAEYRTVRDHLPEHDAVVYAMWLGNEFYDNLVFGEALARVDVERRQHRRAQRKYALLARCRLACFADTLLDRIAPGHALWEPPSRYRAEPDGVWVEGLGNLYVAPTNPMLTRYLEQPYTDPAIERGIEATAAAMADLADLAGPREVVVLLLPFKEQVHAGALRAHRDDLIYDRPQREVLAMCERLGLTCHDLLPTLSAQAHERLFWEYDPHFTPLGQQRAAEAIAPLLNGHSVTGTPPEPQTSRPSFVETSDR